MAGDDRALVCRDAVLEHRLEVLPEALDRIALVLGRVALAVSTVVVGHDPQAEPRECLDLVGPEAEVLGPAVRQHHGRGVLRPERLGVQDRPVGGKDPQLASLQRSRQRLALRVGRDPLLEPALNCDPTR